MKYNFKKICIIICLLIFSTNCIFAHSGRTDSNGGHRDNQNKSGLGSYHYHCGGYPAHLHTNGVCPYSSKSNSNSSSNTSSTSKTSNNKTTSTEITSAEPKVILATGIRINEYVSSMKVGESQKVTATITPTNTTDKNIIWKTSNSEIAVVTSDGEIIAKSSGNVIITATTINGKESRIELEIEKEIEIEEVVIPSISNNVEEIESSSSEDGDLATGIISLSLIGGGSYWGYKKYKQKQSK